MKLKNLASWSESSIMLSDSSTASTMPIATFFCVATVRNLISVVKCCMSRISHPKDLIGVESSVTTISTAASSSTLLPVSGSPNALVSSRTVDSKMASTYSVWPSYIARVKFKNSLCSSNKGASTAGGAPASPLNGRSRMVCKWVRNIPNISTLSGTASGLFSTTCFSRSISRHITVRKSTPPVVCVIAVSSWSSVTMWYSSGKAWMMESKRYCWAMTSLHCTTCSRIFGRASAT
mmetsp:Transcript_13119/g.31713  ORF Transcript_13119/g.31713 Transcript_13119/m.31713 type:complete len:235 (+) Transcript_13119:420-1124(+)